MVYQNTNFTNNDVLKIQNLQVLQYKFLKDDVLNKKIQILQVISIKIKISHMYRK